MYTREMRQAAGRKGGRKTALKYGPAHMSLIGSNGFRAVCEKHFGGDSRKCQNWLNKAKGVGFERVDGCTPKLAERTRLIEQRSQQA